MDEGTSSLQTDRLGLLNSLPIKLYTTETPPSAVQGERDDDTGSMTKSPTTLSPIVQDAQTSLPFDPMLLMALKPTISSALQAASRAGYLFTC